MAATPKRKLSTRRQGKRRSQIKLEAKKYLTCKNCGKPKLAHFLCQNCHK
ncbi:50S ribosomal protein L32 [Candidatus Collierbacteria bacterium]|nr:50S ribosomal protein L32 [Candidatus Collierbacteria bacterium]